jgi:sirohydrochlorin ferrochelatase
LVAVTHGRPSGENREAVIRLVDGVASRRPDIDVSISFVDASNSDVAAALAADAEPDSVIVPLVLSAGFHVRTGLSLGLDRLGGGTRLADELGPDDRIVEVLAERLDELGLADGDAVGDAEGLSLGDAVGALASPATGPTVIGDVGTAVTVAPNVASVPEPLAAPMSVSRLPQSA